MLDAWSGLWDNVKELREEYKCKSMEHEENKSYRRARGCWEYCSAKEKGDDVAFVGSTCICDGNTKELRRVVGTQRLPEHDLLKRQSEGENPLAAFLASKEAQMSAAIATSPDGPVVEDPFLGELTTTNEDGNVETVATSAIATQFVGSTSLANGAIMFITSDVATGTQGVIVPTAPNSSVPSNTAAGPVSSTKIAIAPTFTEASSTASPQQSSDTQQSNDSPGGLSQPAKVGLAVGLGVGIPLLLALIAFLFIRRRKKQSHQQMSPKYETQGQSDLSMIETPHPGAMSSSREPLHPARQEHMKHLDSQQYQAYQPPRPPPPINTFGDEDVFQTPVSAVTRSELRTPTSDGRPMSRHIPSGPPVLTIPEPGATPLHSRDASIDGGVSPVSPVSPVSAVSPVGSRASSPKQQH